MNNPTPSELAALAVAMHAAEHGPKVQPDNLSYTDYFPGALGLICAAKEFLAARERESDPPTKT
jgi:hypothetical protein